MVQTGAGLTISEQGSLQNLIMPLGGKMKRMRIYCVKKRHGKRLFGIRFPLVPDDKKVSLLTESGGTLAFAMCGVLRCEVRRIRGGWSEIAAGWILGREHGPVALDHGGWLGFSKIGLKVSGLA